MTIKDWNIQAKKGTLEFCILLLMEEEDYYGYQIIETLANWSSIAANENTVYPLLRRLTKEGYLKSYWVENADMPRRKYYALTDVGAEYLFDIKISWKKLVEDVNDITQFKGAR